MVKYLKIKNDKFRVIVVGISGKKNSKHPLKDRLVSVSSKKFGTFKLEKTKRNSYDYEYKSFYKKIKRQKDSELINYLKNDTITVSIDDEKYFFTSPKSYAKFKIN